MKFDIIILVFYILQFSFKLITAKLFETKNNMMTSNNYKIYFDNYGNSFGSLMDCV